MTRMIISLLLTCLIFQARSVLAQTYVEVYPGGSFVCGYMPDGTNLIFKKGGSNARTVTVKKAVTSVQMDIDKIKGRIKRLNEIKTSLKDGKLSSDEVRGLKNIVKSADPDYGPVPKGKTERGEAINATIALLKVDVRNRQREIEALRDCGKGKRSIQTIDTIQTEFVKFRALDGIYIALLMHVPWALNSQGQPYPLRWMCVQSALVSTGAPRLFHANPCINGVPAFENNTCPQFHWDGYLEEFYAFSIIRGLPLDLNDPRVLEAEADFQQRYSAGVSSRPRTSLADNCELVG